jgi:peptidoglycan/LPS O-acetylase OafA/YrhL
MAQLNYRTDIDGLRAIAVIPVVLYHLGIPFVGGGFIGVDVFFVISGYLITTIIVSEIRAGSFSLARFYERRIRRIIPAYVVMVAITSIIALQIMLPDDLAEFGQSALFASLSVSNVFFWLESSDYFGLASDMKPLLHTWSLGVEEQFYLFFPLLLLALTRVKLSRFAFLLCVAVAVISLAVSAYGVIFAPMANFYLLPTRAWELLAGGLLAWQVIRPPSTRLQAEVESIVGLVLVIVPIFAYGSRTPFPGPMAMPPVLGAALIIHAGMGNAVSSVHKVLSVPALRFIGIISYSLYLWHWPIMVLSRYYFIELSEVGNAGVLAASMAAAVLSWAFVEQPFRRRDSVISARLIIPAGIAAIAVVSVAGLSLSLSGGFPARLPEGIELLADKRTYWGPGRECGRSYALRRELDDLCVLGREGAVPDLLVVGDSHADALAAAIFNAANASGRSGYQITDTGYRPLLGYRKVGEDKKYEYLNALASETLMQSGIRDVIIPIYWQQAALRDTYWDEENRINDGLIAIESGLRQLIERFPDKRYLVVLSSPNSPSFGASAFARQTWYGRDSFNPTVALKEFERASSAYSAAVEAVSALPNVSVLDLSKHLCDEDLCYGLLNGKPAYTDDNHISYAASRLFEPDLELFLGAPQPPGELAKLPL